MHIQCKHLVERIKVPNAGSNAIYPLPWRTSSGM